MMQSRFTELRRRCAFCAAFTLHKVGGHAVGEKFFWTCEVCGESVALLDSEVEVGAHPEELSDKQKVVAGYLEAIYAEYQAAAVAFHDFHSPHEGLGVLMEEFAEFKAAVYKSKTRHGVTAGLEDIRREAIQVAAMALRVLVDVK